MYSIKQYPKVKKSEISEKILDRLHSILEGRTFVHSTTLYNDIKYDTFKKFGIVSYDIKRKIIRTINTDYEYVAINHIVNMHNHKKYFRKLFFKQLATRYPINNLYCSHTGIWVLKEHKRLLESIVRKLNRKGEAMICCFFTENQTEALEKYLKKLEAILNKKIAQHKSRVSKLEKCIAYAIDNFDKVKKKSKDLSTDFMSFVWFIHRKVYGYYIKIKSTKTTRDLNKKNETEILYRWRKRRIRQYYANEACYKELGVSLAMYTAKIII